MIDYAKYAHLSDVSYGRDSYYMLSAGYTNAVEINKKSEFVSILVNDEEVCVVFRGSDDVQDWTENLKFIPVKKHNIGYVHMGFYEAYEQIKTDLRKILDDWTCLGKRVVFTGHSKGGAMALFASFDFFLRHYDIECHCFTFGAPKAGKSDWVKAYSHCGIHCVQFVNRRDPVPRLPMSLFGWKNVGKVIELGKRWIPFFRGLDRREHRVYAYESYIKKLDLRYI